MAAATAEPLSTAVLSYIDHGAYPDSESLSSSELTPTNLQPLLSALHSEQEIARDHLRTVSRAAGSDVDAWISRARNLQQDIARSRDVARNIVRESEKWRDEESREVKEAENKVDLLVREVQFTEEVERRLEGVKRVRDLVDNVMESVLSGDLKRAVGGHEENDGGLEKTEEVLKDLDLSSTGVGSLLDRRVARLREDVVALAGKRWDEQFTINAKERTFGVVPTQVAADDIVDAATRLGIFDKRILQLAKDVDRCVLQPRMTLTKDEHVQGLQVSTDALACKLPSNDTTIPKVFADVTAIVDFLSSALSPSISGPLSYHLIPFLTTRLINDWLNPALPLDIAEMPAFQDMLGLVIRLADRIDELGWHGAGALREWEKHAPRTWLTKRREAVLGDARNLVFTGLQTTKVVERVETQTITTNDKTNDTTGEGGDDWDEAWETPDEPAGRSQTTEDAADEDDGSAWEVEEPEEQATDAKKTDGDDEGEAWGWDDGDEASLKAPASPKSVRRKPSKLDSSAAGKPAKTTEQEVTYKESYVVTLIPERIMDLLQSVIKDAETLAKEQYSSSPIAPTATALYSLPTLALAIYRATATTAYGKLESGNIMIYNDASFLSEELRRWQASQPSSTRLRLDNDVRTLDQFARRAYSAAMEAQRTIIRDLLDGAQGFSNCTTPPYKAACESAIADTVHHLRTVHKQWQPILSPSALLQSAGSLLATLTGKIIADVEELPDISEADSKQIRILCDQTSEIKDLFMQADPDGEVREMTFIYCPAWMKFQYLGELMESSLADIKYLWNEGELSLEFRAEEVVGLIEALFAESTHRRAAISEIRKNAR